MKQSSHRYFYTFLSIVALLAYSFFVFAAPPTSDYNPGETLDPLSCGPSDPHCKVAVPWLTDTVSGYAYNITDNIGVGTATPTSLFSVGTTSGFQVDTNGNIVSINGVGYSFPGTQAGGAGYALTNNGSGTLSWTAVQTPLTFSTGLTNTTGTVTSNLSTGIAGGQSVIGGTNASDNLTLSSTTNSTKGKILFGTSGYDEANNWLGIGTSTPAIPLDIDLPIGAYTTSASFVGGGFNNATFGGSYSGGNDTDVITVAITATGNPDSFSWHNASFSQTGGPTPITGGAQTLGSTGITVQFSTTSLHTSGDVWYDYISDIPTSAIRVLDGHGNRYFTVNATAPDSNFIGYQAGQLSIASTRSNFLGYQAGFGATAAANSNLLGYQAGYIATNASDSNFMGYQAGNKAINADQSNFFGRSAGYHATNASDSNFIGYQAGNGATGASNSNFIGYQTGNNSTGASGSNFLGYQAGYNLTSSAAVFSNFIGYQAGYTATSAAHSIFIGYQSGDGDTVNNISNGSSILLGDYTSTGGYKNSIALGAYATNTAASQFLVGSSSSPVTDFKVIGDGSGNPWVAVNANQTWLGNGVGTSGGGGSKVDTVLLGFQAGGNAAGADYSNSIGYQAGYGSTSATYANSIGYQAGGNAANATYLNAVGYQAGGNATGAAYSNFVGYQAGYSASNAAGSLFLGYRAGYLDTVNNTSSGTSILIGSNTSTGGYQNSIALGASATNSAANQLVIGSTTSPISQVIVQNNPASCTLSVINGSVGWSCVSDQRLKTNIAPLPSDTLATLDKIKTVTYNWTYNPTGPQNIGFLAQDLQQYYPQEVITGPGGYLEVNYANMVPVVIEGVRELDLKLTNIQNFATATDTTFLQNLINWLGSAANGIGDLFANNVHAKNQLCVGATCVTQQQFLQMVEQANVTPTPSGGTSPTPPSDSNPSPSDTSPSVATPDSGSAPVPTISGSTDGSSDSSNPPVVSPPDPTPDPAPSTPDPAPSPDSSAPTDSGSTGN